MLTTLFCVWYHTTSVWHAEGPFIADYGEMSEWLKEPVLKTGDVNASVGSNPTLSAILFMHYTT